MSTNKDKNIKNGKKGNTNEIPSKQIKKTPAVFYLVIVLIPVIFFILLEVALRIFNYGIDTTQWVQATPEKLMLNSDIARRYFFTTESVPYSNQEVFDKVKAANSFRVFVLGESSAAGYPYMPVGAFSSYLKKRLEILYPSSKIEIVNIGMTAINTYTLRDLFPGVLEQKPDLVLVYTGHNEYYGALGIGSMEFVGSSPALVNFIIYINKFKTVELLRNFIASASKMLSSGTQSNQDGTLMSKIVKNQYIAYGSKEYKAGLNQFESNMKDILQMAKDKNVPVIMGTLTSNIKDQAPFISLKVPGLPEAEKTFNEARTELKNGNASKAKNLFRQAKDLDGIRFRGTEDINGLIRSLGKQFGCYVVEIDSAFCASSPGGIVGNNLMTDHLHPTLSGYQLMGKLFYEVMEKTNLLPKSSPVKLQESELDNLTIAEYKVSKLDSVIAEYRILMLKNDWPFVERKAKKSLDELVKPKDYIDSLAFKVCFENHPWESAHRKAADWYLTMNNFKNFQTQVDILIDRFPVITGYYSFIINKLLAMKSYDEAYNYLLKYQQIKPDAFSTKWLGIIDLSRENSASALNYLKASVQFKSDDPQVLFNLAGAYVTENDYTKALDAIDQCLQVEPHFPGAMELKGQLSTAL